MRRRITPAGIGEILFPREILQLRNGFGEQGVGFSIRLASLEGGNAQAGDSRRSELQEIPPGKIIVFFCESFEFVHNLPDYDFFMCVLSRAFFGFRACMRGARCHSFTSFKDKSERSAAK